MANYDVVGNICIVKFARGASKKKKVEIANEILREKRNVSTVLDRTGKFSGRLRTQKTEFVAGEKTKEALYKENNCIFRFNVDTCYFSPRLSSERLEIAKKVKKRERVLVMFAGVAPFSIVIAKNSKAEEVYSVELGRECTKYAKENVERNKARNVKVLGGDVRKVVPKIKGKFDRIVMARPNLKDSFLDVAFPAIKSGGIIHYYGFYEEAKFGDMREMILEEARKARKKIKVLKIKKAGEVATRAFRYRADVKVY